MSIVVEKPSRFRLYAVFVIIGILLSAASYYYYLVLKPGDKYVSANELGEIFKDTNSLEAVGISTSDKPIRIGGRIEDIVANEALTSIFLSSEGVSVSIEATTADVINREDLRNGAEIRVSCRFLTSDRGVIFDRCAF